LGLAATAWVLRGPGAASDLFQALLKVDPADHTLARNWLLACWVQLERNEDAAALWRRFSDDSAFWQFAGALLAFRQHGDRDQASALLRTARRCDPGFIGYLLGDEVVRADERVRFHGKPARVAHSIARLLLPAWRNTPGAATWARRILSEPLPASAPAAEAEDFPRSELRRLPRQVTTWQLGLRRQDPRADEPREGVPVWLVLIVDVGQQRMRTLTVLEEQPTSAAVWQGLLSAMQSPLEGEPARPAQLIVPSEAFRDAWRPLLRELNVACDFDPQPQPATDLLQGLSELADEQRLPKWSAAIDLGALPQTDDVWQVAFYHSTLWVSNPQAGTYRPWAVLILNKNNARLVANMTVDGEPTPELLLDYVIRAMARTKGGGRPRGIEIADADGFDVLQSKLDGFGVTCRMRDELPELDRLCRELAARPDERAKCALADGRHVTPELMEAFYHAADRYFRQRPWQRVLGEIPIRIECPELQTTRYAVVLGRTGVQLGCCFYDTFRDYENTMLGGGPDRLRALAVCYDEAMIMAGVDLWYIERKGWPIASPEAYPAAWRTEPGGNGRPPTADELTFMTAALEVLPLFLASPGKPTNYEVQVGGRSLNLQLAW
jgi:hypothetical protein